MSDRRSECLADSMERDAAALRAAAWVMRRRFGGLETCIAVLETKADALTCATLDPEPT